MINEILVTENNKVKTEQIIAKIKDDDYAANYKKSLAINPENNNSLKNLKRILK